jgi:hypothetical protein
MATSVIASKVKVTVETQGLDTAVQQSEKFHDNLVKGSAAIASAFKNTAKSVSSVAAALSEEVPVSARARKGSKKNTTADESDDYGVSRSLRPGGTGASARDFAKEASGLGGLVRLYATYAANVFAVGAAYRALSNAMDTSNMVRGLDQLGAASGMALGSLSQQLVKVTDGAISMREAMESVAKASSSGMSANNILRMGKIAKQASQALGVDVSDAVNRLTRGITKLEPELLDELGIFTRVDSAVKDYAKSVGKSTLAITDFEKRAAFANAVLAEGEKKFGEIDMETNPYTKLLASVKDLGQKGLEIINKVLSPLVKFLSESPSALAVAIGAVGLALVKQALPAFGQVKQALQAQAEMSKELAISRVADAKKAADAISQINAEAMERRTTQAEEHIGVLDKLNKARIKASPALSNLMSTDLVETDRADIDKKIADAKTERIRLRKALDFEINNKGAWSDESRIIQLREEIQLNKDVVQAARNTFDMHKKWASEDERIAKQTLTLKATMRLAERAEHEALKQSIVSNAVYNSGLIGTRDAIGLMREEMAKSGKQFTALETVSMTAKASMLGFATSVMTIASAFGNFLGVIGLVVTAFGILDSLLSSASANKALAEYSESLDRTEKAADNVVKTIDRMARVSKYSTQALQAQTNATLEVVDSLHELAVNGAKAYEEVNKPGWNNLTNLFKSIFNKDVRSTFGKNLSDTIVTSVGQLSKGPVATKLKEDIASILELKNLDNLDLFRDKVAALGLESEKIKLIEKAFKDSHMAAGIASGKATDFAESLKKTKESYQEVGKSFENKDPLTKFATDSIGSLAKLSDILKGPIQESISSLATTLNDLSSVPLFGGEKSRELAGFADEMAGIQKSVQANVTELDSLEKKLTAVQSKLKAAKADSAANTGLGGRAYGASRFSPDEESPLVSEEAKLLSAIKAAKATEASLFAQATGISVKVASNINEGMAKGVDFVALKLESALAKGSTSLLQKLYAASDIIPELAAKQYDLKIQELAQEQTYLQAQLSLIKEMRMNNALLAVANAEKAVEAPNRTPEAREKALRDLSEANKYKENLDKVFKDPSNALRGISEELRAGTSGVSQEQVKNLTEVANQISGINVSMAGVSRQIQDIKVLEKPLDLLNSTFKNIESNVITTQRDALDLKDKQLKLDKESGRYSEMELFTKDLALQKEKSELQYAQEALAARKEDLKTQLIVEGLRSTAKKGSAGDVQRADATALEIEGKRLFQSKLDTASKKEAADALARQSALQLELYNQEGRRLTQARLIEDIYQATEASTYTYVDALNDVNATRITREREIGRLTDEQAARLLSDLDREKAGREYILSLREKERAFIRAQEDLDRRFEAPNATADERARIVAEGEARTIAYNEEVKNINNIHKLKLLKIDEALNYEINARKREMEKTIVEALVTGMTKGGKEGARVVREYLANEFRRVLTIRVQAELSKTKVTDLANIGANLAGSVLGGFKTYSLGSGLSGGLMDAGAELFNAGFQDFGNTLLDAGSALGDFSGMLDTAGTGLSVLGTAMRGDYGAAIGEGLGLFLGGGNPIAGMVGKFLGSMLGLTDDSGTLHTGGAASYSATQGTRTGRSVMNELDFGVEVNESAQQAAAGLAQGLVSLLDSTAVTFGKEAGYYAATGFADDTSKDGAWGALSIKLGEKMILDWGKGADKWPGREFADGAEGQKEYLNAIAVDTKKVLMDMDLPTWADNILNAIGDSPTIEMLQAAMNQISKLNTVFDTFSEALGWSRESLEKLLGPLGGVDSAITKLGFYYENFFTDTEKLSRATEKLDDKFEKMGKAVPKTTEGFRSLVDAAQAAGDGALVNSLLEVAPAFVQVTKAIKEAAEAAREAARLMNAAWADVLETRGVDSSNFAAQADINAAWKQYQETDKYAQTSPTNFKTITFDDFTKNYTTEQQQLIARILKGYDTLNKSLLKNAEAALSTLKKSLDAQKEVYKEQLTVQEGLVTKLKGIFDSLQVHIDELYRNVVSTSNLSIIEGNRLIDSVISTRVLPESDTLMKAVEAAKSGTVDTNYSSRFDAERDRLILAGKLTDIQSIAKTELTAAELQVKYLKDQIDLLDRIYLENELAVQTLQGINESVLSVTDAVNALKQAMLDAKAPTTPTTSTAATGAGFVIGGTSPGASFGPGASTNPTDNYAPGQRGIGGNYLAEHYMGSYGSVFNEVDSTKQSQLEGVAAILQPFDGTGDVYGAAMAVKEAGGTMTDIASVMGYSYLDVFNALTEAGVPRFATGGDHFGGVRLVGEEGPELEFTGPSRILNNRQTMDMFQNNTGEEMQKMREEFTKLTEAQLKQSQEISRLFKRWDSDGLPSTRVEV